MKTRIFIIFILGVLITINCNLSFGIATPTLNEEEMTRTSVSLTAEAQGTRDAEEQSGEGVLDVGSDGSEDTPTTTNSPTATHTHTSTPTPTSTPDPGVCDQAGFVSDLSIPDGTQLEPNEPFTKQWRLINNGTCTWTTAYQLVYESGTNMGGPASQALPSNVPPGGTVDLAIGLTAPGTEGVYRGNYKLRNDDGDLFGLSNGGPFYVEIEVVAPAAPPPPNPPTPTATPIPMPDLVISFIELDPSTPTQGNPVTVKVQVYNQGNAAAGAFTVSWWAGSNYPSSACNWNVASLVANGGYVLTCNYGGYPSWYASITTVARADTANSVAESNESNNANSMVISVDP